MFCVFEHLCHGFSLNEGILLANSNQWYFNKLVKIPCHKTPYRCPHRLNLSSQSSRSCAGPNIKVLKDKDLEFANSIRGINENASKCFYRCRNVGERLSSCHLNKQRLINPLEAEVNESVWLIESMGVTPPYNILRFHRESL